MTDLDPKIWENPTLGEAAAGPFLDEIEAQQKEDLNARRDGREPRIAVHYPRHPQFISSESVPSSIGNLEFVDADGDGIPDDIDDEVTTPVDEVTDTPPTTGHVDVSDL